MQALKGDKKLTFNEIRQSVCQNDGLPDTMTFSNQVMVSIRDMVSKTELTRKRDEKGVFRYSISIPVKTTEVKKPISRAKMKEIIESKPIAKKPSDRLKKPDGLANGIEMCQSYRVGEKVFNTLEEAEEHATVSDEDIGKFLEAYGIEQKTRGLQARTIRRWERFRQKVAAGTPP